MNTLKSWQARSQKFLNPESSYSPVAVFSSFSDEPEKEHESSESLTQGNESQSSLDHVEEDASQKPKDKRYVLYQTLSIALGVLFVASLLFNIHSSTNALSPSPFAAQDVVNKDTAFFPGPQETFAFSNGTKWVRPAALKVTGIVFFGRRQFVDLLDCYLRRNLRVNGGMLDEVHFLMHTDVEADERWLRRLIRSHNMGEYYKMKAEDTNGDWNLWQTFDDLYKNFMTDPDTIYVKVDDDILFVDDNAIPELVRTTLEHPEVYAVMSNNINNKWGLWHHHRANAIRPYLAAKEEDSVKWSPKSWRASELPFYDGEVPEKDHDFTREYEPPQDGHRWLPLRHENNREAEAISHTPWGPWLPNPMYHNGKWAVGWAVTAQAHYSFFENFEKNNLATYHFGGGDERLWNLWYTRWSINFIAIRGSYVSLHPMGKNDELVLTTVIPRELDMPVVVATRAITAHFSFRGDRTELFQTDIMDRYRALANEFVCKPTNQKGRWGDKLGPHHTSEMTGEHDEDREDDDAHIGDGPADERYKAADDEEDENNEEMAGEKIASAAPGASRVP